MFSLVMVLRKSPNVRYILGQIQVTQTTSIVSKLLMVSKGKAQRWVFKWAYFCALCYTAVLVEKNTKSINKLSLRITLSFSENTKLNRNKNKNTHTYRSLLLSKTSRLTAR